jgi:very-short-patch-repair endonuclease
LVLRTPSKDTAGVNRVETARLIGTADANGAEWLALTGWVGETAWIGHRAEMTRTPRIPPELTKKPFSLDEARCAGLTHSSLQGKAWRRLGAELYCWEGLRQDPWLQLSALLRMLPREAVFAGATAAWMLGLDLVPDDPVEIIVSIGSGIRSRPGLTVRRGELPASDVATIRGLRATTLHRTLCDLCLRLPAVNALIAIDMAVHMGFTDANVLRRYSDAVQGRAGAYRLRSLAALAADAESPMETRLRWLLIHAGLPHPEVQTKLRDREQRFLGRADLYYPVARLILEYDGTNHRDRLVQDNRRQNLLINAGFRLLRFTATDIYQHPEVVVAQVRSALSRSVSPSRTRASRPPSRRAP